MPFLELEAGKKLWVCGDYWPLVFWCVVRCWPFQFDQSCEDIEFEAVEICVERGELFFDGVDHSVGSFAVVDGYGVLHGIFAVDFPLSPDSGFLGYGFFDPNRLCFLQGIYLLLLAIHLGIVCVP